MGLKNFTEMSFLATIAGNDLINYDGVKGLHSRLLEEYGLEDNVKNKFLAIAKFVREELRGKSLEEAIDITANKMGSRSAEERKPKIKKSLEMYQAVS